MELLFFFIVFILFCMVLGKALKILDEDFHNKYDMKILGVFALGFLYGLVTADVNVMTVFVVLFTIWFVSND